MSNIYRKAHILRRSLLLGAAVASLAAIAGLAKPETVAAHHYPCHTPNACTAHFYGYGMWASFSVEGFPIYAQWNFTSTTSYQAWPQSGHATEIYHVNHSLYTTASWPSGTWNRSQWTTWSGLQLWKIPSQQSYSAAIGPNAWAPSEFSHSLSGYISPVLVFDNEAKTNARASFYPAGGASSASNNVRDQCKKLTVNGAVAIGCY